MNKEEYQKQASKLAKLREQAIKIARDFSEQVDRKIAAKIAKRIQSNLASSEV